MMHSPPSSSVVGNGNGHHLLKAPVATGNDTSGVQHRRSLPSPRSTAPSADSKAWPAGFQVLAQYDFKGTSSEDLAFYKGQVLEILARTTDPNWFMAAGPNGRGLIPVNYVTPLAPHSPTSASGVETPRTSAYAAERSIYSTQPWFHGKLSRDQTEQLLQRKTDGTFLVRESTNYPGDYTLCLAYANKVEHYRIQRHKGLFTCDEEEYFDNLGELVEHYKLDADGLCHHLTSPVPRPPPPGDDEPDSVAVKSNAFKSCGWCISRNELSLGDTIGHGEFGEVLVGYYEERKVAVKVLKQASRVVESLLEEAALMTSLRHLNLVQLLGVVLDDVKDVFMVTEFMANGNLVDYLRSRGRHAVDKKHMCGFARDVAHGMCYLESKQLVHRDLAARNILLSDEMHAKISDFGLAKQADASSLETNGKFPIKWTAPEALRHSRFTNKSDVWSFGILLWEIYSYGRVPYPRIPIQDVIRHIERGYRMEPPEGCPKSIAAVMSDAWALKPTDRPTFAQLSSRLDSIYSEEPSAAQPLVPRSEQPATTTSNGTATTANGQHNSNNTSVIVVDGK